MEVQNSPPEVQNSPPGNNYIKNVPTTMVIKYDDSSNTCSKSNISFLTADMYCKYCDVKCCKLSDWKRHLLTKRHTSKANEKSPLLISDSNNYSCISCNYNTSRISDWNKHIKSKKHNNINKNNNNYICNNCNKTYTSYNGLWKHKKVCNNDNIVDNISYKINDITESNIDIIESNNDNENINSNCDNDTNYSDDELNNHSNNIIISKDSKDTNKDEIINLLLNDHNEFKNLIIEVVKNNNEFQRQMMDLIKTTTNNNNINSNNINSHNQNHFNLQFFLNETCKDAMNMTDFVNSFDLKMSDLERLGEDGYVNTMSRLIINKVRELDVEKRPIHCSDARREIVYIKDDGVWVKDDEDKTRLRTVVNKVGSKNINILYKWQASHPDYWEPESPDNSTYLNIMMEVMGGKDTRGNEDKVIKRIIKEVVIDKQQYIK
jgi:hypothetical protein